MENLSAAKGRCSYKRGNESACRPRSLRARNSATNRKPGISVLVDCPRLHTDSSVDIADNKTSAAMRGNFRFSARLRVSQLFDSLSTISNLQTCRFSRRYFNLAKMRAGRHEERGDRDRGKTESHYKRVSAMLTHGGVYDDTQWPLRPSPMEWTSQSGCCEYISGFIKTVNSPGLSCLWRSVGRDQAETAMLAMSHNL